MYQTMIGAAQNADGTARDVDVMTAMTPRATGSRDVIDSTLSALYCAAPPNNTGRSAGPGTACRDLSCSLEAAVNSGALLCTVRNALPLATPVGADGGPASSPATNVPAGVDTPNTSETCERSAA